MSMAISLIRPAVDMACKSRTIMFNPSSARCLAFEHSRF